MWRIGFVVWMVPLWMTSCGTGPAISEFCKVASPIYVSRQDQLIEGTKQQILEHNLKGEKLCGWKRTA